MSEYAWQPTAEYVEQASVTRFMRAHGIETIAELRRRSVEDVSWYWDAVVKDLGIPFSKPYDAVLDESRGIEWARWFTGGHVNLTSACVDRWRSDPDRSRQDALIGEAEDGEV